MCYVIEPTIIWNIFWMHNRCALQMSFYLFLWKERFEIQLKYDVCVSWRKISFMYLQLTWWNEDNLSVWHLVKWIEGFIMCDHSGYTCPSWYWMMDAQQIGSLICSDKALPKVAKCVRISLGLLLGTLWKKQIVKGVWKVVLKMVTVTKLSKSTSL